ncbi:hypothetical protein N7495_000042 [Penicillium taxi]|uniref:uncharacterized protein n=1 Tax=Penicillium taxi TaxID=168475 RepID=UPI0025454B82|nr:uncharacterized protein N7495_000042 [Penicillium taxi]KAJ5907360.1 hypothetical protein N7495_000042 [Penicillium taxi]
MNTIGRSLILSILILLPWKTGAVTVTCGTADISSNSVGNCECAPSFSEDGCGACTDPFCGDAKLKGKLAVCNAGCVQQNLNCSACGLYFGSVCRCLKGAPGCSNNGDWWLLNSHDLISTTKRVPGIVQLGSDNTGWQLGQTLLAWTGISLSTGTATRKTGTLAVNSVKQRDEEQIHIHVCNRPNNQLRDYLSTKVRPDQFQSLKPLETSFPEFPTKSVLCQASQTKGDNHVDVAGITADHLNKAKGCDESQVGAGLITDTNDYSWVCITTGYQSGGQLFCRT